MPSNSFQRPAPARAVITAWDMPADPDTPASPTSEFLANAPRHEPNVIGVLAVTCICDQPPAAVHDISRTAPVIVDAPASAEAEPHLTPVANPPTAPGCPHTAARDATYLRRFRWMY
jgi:hypothetical protein